MTLTLTIKKFYFDQIAAGEKSIEYRKISPYYERLFQRKYTRVVFHYYRKNRLSCEVIRIRKIKKPRHLKNSTYLIGDTVWAIHLANPITSIKQSRPPS